MSNTLSKIAFRIVAPAAVLGAALAMAAPAGAQGMGQGGGQGTGPVGQTCAADLAKYCAKAPHGAGEARACLEDNRAKLTADCRNALDNTGGGRGMGRGQQN
ncbi:hypothetical protein [Blastochloris viridis]|uniref:Cysteine rich repeat n=1 Tax=Blastochloris viridis TaxID=1079 RepID=A0A0H5B7P2_BLAVI|nr:hypothetical protein [Blastochloris viridis]ALK08518.1 hypothetical protein BVIR_724 [Blastochloris viridis]BAR98195.1 hypothetical protein BV133_602 [Blastochloris viridis]CUU41180.1 hypothetical protein BVIRIDIS_01680 [Blastochloris viridis]